MLGIIKLLRFNKTARGVGNSSSDILKYFIPVLSIYQEIPLEYSEFERELERMNTPVIQNVSSNIWHTLRSTAIGHDNSLRKADISNWAMYCVERAYMFRNHQN
jgi:hypothetical protein